ncbi:MAG TPA: hypothetical protein ENN06_09260, partial [Desulfobacteraceae bacterium]|nr:hypothetical protein [Desulfobacteraceae bacterium]
MCEEGKSPGAATCCDVCGNEIEVDVTRCPFCRSPRTEIHKAKIKLPFRTVNLENGLPTVEQAIERLRHEISLAAREGCRVLILIHGWGSSGQGGAIKQEVRRRLTFMLDMLFPAVIHRQISGLFRSCARHNSGIIFSEWNNSKKWDKARQ